MKTIRIGSGAGYSRRPHRAGGRTRRAWRPPLPRLRVPGRAHHRAGAAGAAARPRGRLRSAAGGADAGGAAGLRRRAASASSPTWARPTRSAPRATRPQSRGGLGLAGLRIAAVTGDDVLRPVRGGDFPLLERPGTVADLGDGDHLGQRLSRASTPIVAALRGGADVVITGRVGDPALFLAPLVHEFGWALDDWRSLGRGTVVGHLLECAGQITGGYFADPGYKDVRRPGAAGLSDRRGGGRTASAVITKVAGSGGAVTPAHLQGAVAVRAASTRPRYLQPDVVADFSGVRLAELAPDRVAVSGGTGRGAAGHAEGLGRLPRQLRGRGPDLLRRPGRRGARPAGAGDRARAADS